jgi:4'-phosphopantetheinyl transferase
LDLRVKDKLPHLPVLEIARGVPGVTALACNSLDWARAEKAALRALSEPEAERVARMKNPEARERLLASLAGTRRMLGQVLDMPASDVDLQRDADGAPFLADQTDRRLSISRSEGWTAVALGDARSLGLDIERMRSIDWRPMLAMVCRSAERDAMLALEDGAPDRALSAFFELWTIKEAVLKAVGKGLRGGAKGVPVQVATLGRPDGALRRISFGQAGFAVCTEWHDGLVVSVAVGASAQARSDRATVSGLAS